MLGCLGGKNGQLNAQWHDGGHPTAKGPAPLLPTILRGLGLLDLGDQLPGVTGGLWITAGLGLVVPFHRLGVILARHGQARKSQPISPITSAPPHLRQRFHVEQTMYMCECTCIIVQGGMWAVWNQHPKDLWRNRPATCGGLGRGQPFLPNYRRGQLARIIHGCGPNGADVRRFA